MITPRFIIQWIVQNIDYNVEVKDYTVNTDGTVTILSCDTGWLRTGKLIKIDGEWWRIKDFAINKYVLVEPYNHANAIVSMPTHIICNKLGYQCGTLRDAQGERGSKRDVNTMFDNPVLGDEDEIGSSVAMLPFLWSRHPLNWSENWEDVSPVHSTYEFEWYLLDETNIEDYLVVDDEREVIEPIRNLWGRVKDLINANRQYFNEVNTDVNVTQYKNIGVTDENGSYESLFREDLSGLRIRLNLEVREQFNECCKSLANDDNGLDAGLNFPLNNTLNG